MTSRRNSSDSYSTGKESKSHGGDDEVSSTAAGGGFRGDVEKGYTTAPAATTAFPARSATFQIPNNRHRSPTTIEALQREKTLEATQSIGGLSLSRANARQGLDPRARVAAEFRTLSVQLGDGVTPVTKKSKKKQLAEKGKWAWL